MEIGKNENRAELPIYTINDIEYGMRHKIDPNSVEHNAGVAVAHLLDSIYDDLNEGRVADDMMLPKQRLCMLIQEGINGHNSEYKKNQEDKLVTPSYSSVFKILPRSVLDIFV